MYIFSFSFSEVSSVKYHIVSQSLAELEVNVVGDKSASAIHCIYLGKKQVFSL